MEDERRITALDIVFDMHACTASLKCEKPATRKDGEGVEVVGESAVITW
jgi:hypothetical protein